MATVPPPHSTTKAIVEVEYMPVKLVNKLEALLKDIMINKERNGGFARIQIEIANGDVKRFEVTEPYLMSAL